MGAPSQSVKIPPSTNSQELSVCPFPSSIHPISLSLLASSISFLFGAGAASAPARAMALKKVMCPSWLAQEVRATNIEPSCRRFSPCFGAAWLPQETCVLNSLSLTCCCQPRCGSRAREQRHSLLPASPGCGGSHFHSRAGLPDRMRIENHGAKVPKMAWSLLPSSQLLGMACSHPREEAGGHADGHVLSLLCESSHLDRLTVHRPALPPWLWPGASQIQG